ncbi:MAG TPA: hypothetical protein VE152_05425 [Acidimicrobiales bacterium]|nr:hypothetical protein [Acidimicrobiales bacterium]
MAGTAGGDEVGAPGLDHAHEWLSFEDPDEARTWVVDVTFLLSHWSCIFGRGCQGVLTAPAPERVEGCCSYGAHFTGPEDAERVEAAAATLGPEEWQHRRRGRNGVTKAGRSGEVVTRMVDGACIFLNRPGFPAGAGCALHQAAVRRGQEPMELKPDVCWQLPLRREDEVGPTGHVTSTLTQWDRRHWGPGGEEFAWWCTEAPEAFTGARPVYQALRHELIALVGARPYRRMRRYLDWRLKAPGSPLPHPARRRG